jgi:hypothetical protein
MDRKALSEGDGTSGAALGIGVVTKLSVVCHTWKPQRLQGVAFLDCFGVVTTRGNRISLSIRPLYAATASTTSTHTA